jgi:hypothetical protein
MIPANVICDVRAIDYLSISVSVCASTALLDLGRFFQFLNLHAAGRTPWTGDQTVARPLPTRRTT